MFSRHVSLSMWRQSGSSSDIRFRGQLSDALPPRSVSKCYGVTHLWVFSGSRKNHKLITFVFDFTVTVEVVDLAMRKTRKQAVQLVLLVCVSLLLVFIVLHIRKNHHWAKPMDSQRQRYVFGLIGAPCDPKIFSSSENATKEVVPRVSLDPDSRSGSNEKNSGFWRSYAFHLQHQTFVRSSCITRERSAQL